MEVIMVWGGGLLVITFNSYIPWTEQQQLHSLDGTAFTLVAHVASSGNVRDIFINMHYFCLCCELTYVGGYCQCVYAHCRCEWGAWSRRQKLCTASLVEARTTVQSYS